MRIALVGPEIEENLGLRYLAAALIANGDHAEVIAFDEAREIASVAEAAARHDVDVIGLSMMFQLRAREFVVLAERIRALGWTGTLVAGGQHATFMADEILADNPAFDAIVLGDGEAPLVDVIEALRGRRSLLSVPGLVVRTDDGAVVHTDCRHDRTDLESLPEPIRNAHPRLHMGLPSAPMIASRGCYASCTFCSIAAWEKLSGGPRYRVRPAEHVAREMAELYFERGVRVFNFHDDNFWFPKVEANRERLDELQRELRAHRVGDIALCFKCRPTDVDRELFARAKDMGMVRIYVGIETDAPAGLISLRRGVAQPQNQRALEILSALDVHALSNLLLFDPDTRLGDIAHNIDFIERYAHLTLNFCRVEPYGGTPLTRRLAAEGRLVGDYLGYDYTLREPRVELMWRIAHVAFHDRNFPANGLANALIALAYRFHLAKRFWPSPELEALRAPIEDFVVRFNRDQVRVLRAIYEHVQTCDLAARDVSIELAMKLALEVRATDARLAREHAALVDLVEGYAAARGAGGSSGRLGEGAAGSGWWHLGAPLAGLALAACTNVEAQPQHFAQPPDTKPAKAAALVCTRDGKTHVDLMLKDAASAELVKQAAPKQQADGTWLTTASDVEGTFKFAQMYSRGNGCGGGGFYGWDTTVELSGAAAANYELVGFAGWNGVNGNTIARAADDHWVRFQLGNPGKTTNRLAVIFKKRGIKDSPLVAIAADVPQDPTPPPPPPDQRMRHPGCDPVAMPVAMSAPIDTNRVVHFAIEGEHTPVGHLNMRTWIDPTVKNAKLVGKPKITSEYGTLSVLGAATDYQGTTYADFSLELRCDDGRVIPKKFKLRARWVLEQNGRNQTYDGTLEVELQPDGTLSPVAPAGPKHGELDPLPLGKRYAGTIDASDGRLRAIPPRGVEVLEARWHADGELAPTADPLTVEVSATSAVCVMRVADGLCIASWSASCAS